MMVMRVVVVADNLVMLISTQMVTQMQQVVVMVVVAQTSASPSHASDSIYDSANLVTEASKSQPWRMSVQHTAVQAAVQCIYGAC